MAHSFRCDHANCQRVPYREVYFKRGGWAYACRPHFKELRDDGRLRAWCCAERAVRLLKPTRVVEALP